MKLFYRYKNRLFFAYSITTIIITFLLTIIFYRYTSNILNQNSNQILIQTAEKIVYKIDTIVQSMDTTTLQVLSNNDVQKIMKKSSQYHEANNYFDFYDKSIISNILKSINSPFITNARVSVFDQNRNYVTVGSLGENYDAFINNFSKYDILFNKDFLAMQKILLPTQYDNWVSKKHTIPVISLIRKIPNISTAGQVIGYVEVEQPYSLIEDARSLATESTIHVTIIDNNNQIIAPYNELTDQQLAYYVNLKQLCENSHVNHLKNNSDYVYIQKSQVSGWSIILTQSAKDYNKALIILQKLVILFSLCFYFLTILLVFKITNRLTTPITELRKSVENISSTTSMVQMKSPYYNEINMLKDAFNHSIQKLNTSMEQTIIANQNQVQSHILAMQSQMNPHFLFNTLMGISGIAEEGNNEKIVLICDKLASMLRYISSFKDAKVNIKEEIDYSIHYLELMKIRYEDFLQYSFEIEDEVYTHNVSKLILQPLLENCFSHGFKNVIPPYEIKVHIRIRNEQLELSVYDNGEGFSELEIVELNDKFNYYRSQSNAKAYIDNSELGGLGLMNIYLRLLFQYGPNTQMIIRNAPTRGCYVIIRIPNT